MGSTTLSAEKALAAGKTSPSAFKNGQGNGLYYNGA